MTGRIILITGGKGRDFQELGHHALFELLWLDLELWGPLWVCHFIYANVLQWVYNKVRGPLEVESSAILDLVGTTQFCHVLGL